MTRTEQDPLEPCDDRYRARGGGGRQFKCGRGEGSSADRSDKQTSRDEGEPRSRKREGKGTEGVTGGKKEGTEDRSTSQNGITGRG